MPGPEGPTAVQREGGGEGTGASGKSLLHRQACTGLAFLFLVPQAFRVHSAFATASLKWTVTFPNALRRIFSNELWFHIKKVSVHTWSFTYLKNISCFPVLIEQCKRHLIGPRCGYLHASPHGVEPKPERDIPSSAGSLRSVDFQMKKKKKIPGWRISSFQPLGSSRWSSR